ncbi:MAG: alpha-mannosidase [Epulopiscium sp.]|nr:alpha-mannosidase [Candidatus Epulonipiscium sp.]
MYYIKERISKIIFELKRRQYGKELIIEEYEVLEGNYLTEEDVPKEAVYQKVSKDYLFGGFENHYAFKFDIQVPEDFQGKTIGLYIAGAESGWDYAINPQFLLYVNDELRQGIDLNHRENILTYDAQAGTNYHVYLHCYSGRTRETTTLKLKLFALDKETRDLYFNLITPYFVANKLPKDDINHIEIIEILNETINLLDLREYYTDAYYNSIRLANTYIKEEFYEKKCKESNIIATCIGHTHIDVAWLWTVDQTKEKVLRSFSTVLSLMEQYPEYLFMSSQPVLYEFVKEKYPPLLDKIREKVKEGSWEPEGAMYVEADCNVTSGESLVRQILYGTKIFKEEFGATNEVLWLPDVFGYSAALPQILQKSNIKYFMTTKIAWNQYNKMPYDTFMWKGIDGSEVLTHFITTQNPGHNPKEHFTTYNGILHPETMINAWDRYQQKGINQDVLVAFGYGDGGGGATYEMLEMGRRLSKGIQGSPTVKMGKVKDYFKRLEARVKNNKKLPKWTGELYLEYHRGTYTSMARNKRDNRKSEIIYTDLEKILTFKEVVQEGYDKEALDKAWKTILLNQFHDILPGTSIKDVYDVTQKEYEQLVSNEGIKEALVQLSKNMYIEKEGVLAFNTTSFQRNTLVSINAETATLLLANEKIAEKNSIFYFEDEFGTRYTAQISADGEILLLDPSFPAMGYKLYRLVGCESIDSKEMVITNHLIETGRMKLNLNDKGQLVSIVDKVRNRELLKEGRVGNELRVFEDRPMNYDNWDIDIYYREKSWAVDNLIDIEVLEQGPIRGALKLSYTFLNSTIEQIIYVYNHTSRIDFKHFIDWDQSQLLLKTNFPADINSTQATYEIQYGNIKRNTTENNTWDVAQFEVVGHKWADLSETGFGISILNDSKYGYRIKDGEMELTLIKSGIEPNPVSDREKHYFVYSLFSHEGDYTQDVIKEAYDLNYKIHTIKVEANSQGKKVRNSFVTTDKENIIIEVMKKSEDQKDTIIRLYESQNKRTKVNLEFLLSYSEIIRTNLLEEDEYRLAEDTNKLFLTIKPFEIVTLRLKK